MHTKLVVVCFLATSALAGCSSSGEQSVDYHSLISTTQRTEESPAYKDAEMKCNSSQTEAETTANPWCSAVYKARVCSSTMTINGVVTTAQLAQVEKHPTAKCPPK